MTHNPQFRTKEVPNIKPNNKVRVIAQKMGCQWCVCGQQGKITIAEEYLAHRWNGMEYNQRDHKKDIGVDEGIRCRGENKKRFTYLYLVEARSAAFSCPALRAAVTAGKAEWL